MKNFLMFKWNTLNSMPSHMHIQAAPSLGQSALREGREHVPGRIKISLIGILAVKLITPICKAKINIFLKFKLLKKFSVKSITLN